MWIVVDLLAIVGAWTIGAWVYRNVCGAGAEKELPYQPLIVLHELKPGDVAVPVKPVEIKAKRQPRKRKAKA